MNKKRNRRILAVILILSGAFIAVVLSKIALEESVMFFYTPKDLKEEARNIPEDQIFRLGGYVKDGSMRGEGEIIFFSIIDDQAFIPVTYRGLLPDLFREGQGVVVVGTYDGAIFTASRVLTKHDENYRPPEIERALGGNPASKNTEYEYSE